jgi:hypothetical protein
VNLTQDNLYDSSCFQIFLLYAWCQHTFVQCSLTMLFTLEWEVVYIKFHQPHPLYSVLCWIFVLLYFYSKNFLLCTVPIPCWQYWSLRYTISLYTLRLIDHKSVCVYLCTSCTVLEVFMTSTYPRLDASSNLLFPHLSYFPVQYSPSLPPTKVSLKHCWLGNIDLVAGICLF